MAGPQGWLPSVWPTGAEETWIDRAAAPWSVWISMVFAAVIDRFYLFGSCYTVIQMSLIAGDLFCLKLDEAGAAFHDVKSQYEGMLVCI